MKKEKHIHIRVSADQHAVIMREARKRGLTVSEYVLKQIGVGDE